MASDVSASESSSSHDLIANVSFLAGIAVFLLQVWGRASLEHVLTVTVSTGLAVYLILAMAYAAAQGVMAYEPPAEGDESPSDDAAEKEANETNAPAAHAAASHAPS